MTGSNASSRPELPGSARWADEAYARTVVPHRDVGTHKWEVGGVVVIAGSPALTGAAYLACRAAGRAGAGIVYLASGRSVITMLTGAMPEVAHILLPETDAPGAARRAIERLDPYLDKAASVVIGPGLGDDEATDHLLSALFGFGDRKSRASSHIGFGDRVAVAGESSPAAFSPLFAREQLTVVVDADGLNWLAKQEHWWDYVPTGRLVLTPHPGEMARMTGRETSEIIANPVAIAEEYASAWRQAVVIKSGYAAASDGERTVVADDAPTSLATAGTGDVLAGAIGAYLAQGVEPVDAAGLAFYTGTRAARTVESIYGELGVIATDLPDVIATELRQIS
jgi:ADP-dependent NAD(P)H-hydrate dehydratase / NAD(P)H-hydrate epimerase